MARTASTTQSTGSPTLDEWAKLDLCGPNSRVLRLTRVQLDGNSRPLGVEEVVLALERLPGLAANGADIPDIHRAGPAAWPRARARHGTP